LARKKIGAHHGEHGACSQTIQPVARDWHRTANNRFSVAMILTKIRRAFAIRYLPAPDRLCSL